MVSSPLARAFLAGALRDVVTLETKDIRRGMPRFEVETYAKYLALLPVYQELARGEHVITIPGRRSRAHLRENLGAGAPDADGRPDDAAGRPDQSAQRGRLHCNAATTVQMVTWLFT